ncbi:glyoxalase [Serinibacter arcticus]|uniref:Glyoxalase n=1 Tax=Serinibacter arcticus TaxID=1655435 RepID=A0A2U1ZR96_9MICO|nr:VOC family protein [Serinibacter arcticus]PWD49496.1 glyoxalase [Serinibacter arcticus]
MGLNLGMITTDSTDPVPLAHWWAGILDGEVLAENEGWFVVVSTPSGTLAFQKVDEVTPGKNRVHVDLVVDGDLDVEHARLVELGAASLGERSEGENRWFTLADPQGNEFCVATEATEGP